MRRGVSVCFVAVLLITFSATLALAEVLLPGDIAANPSKYVNTSVRVQGQVKGFAKSGDLNYKFRYSLTYKGAEVPVLTNKMVDDDAAVTVRGKVKYDTAESTYFIIESTTLPPLWMMIVGGALVVVLVVVLILIFRSPKQDPVVVEQEAPVRYCDQCGAILHPNGVCPICSMSIAGSQPPTAVTSGVETVGTGTVERKRADTMLMDAPAKAMLVLRNGNSGSYNVGSGSTKIGRNSSNDFVIDEQTVSGEHAKVIEEEGNFFLQDLGSKNGTFVNGEKVVRQQLNDGDLIKLGKAEMKFVSINEK